MLRAAVVPSGAALCVHHAQICINASTKATSLNVLENIHTLGNLLCYLFANEDMFIYKHLNVKIVYYYLRYHNRTINRDKTKNKLINSI